jgi:iron complex transport system permease protein
MDQDIQDKSQTQKSRRGKRIRVMVILTLILFGLMVFASGVGAVKIAISDITGIFLSKFVSFPQEMMGWPDSHYRIFWIIRLPRIVMAVLVGYSLSTAGTALQGVLQNHLADPYLIGLSSGAALGASIGIIARKNIPSVSSATIPIFAFAGGIISLILVYTISKKGRQSSTINLILAGVAVSSFFSAIVSFLIVKFGERMEEIIFWMMGGLANSTWANVRLIMPYIAVGSVIIIGCGKILNVMSLGDEKAKHLGVNVDFYRKLIIASATLISATAVSVTGLIGFVGLMVPHMFRRIVGADHRILIPAAGLGGAIVLLLADTLSRTALAPKEIPVGIMTAVLGAPFFMYLLRSRRI